MQMISIQMMLLTGLMMALMGLSGRFLKEDRKKILASKLILLAASFLFAAYGDLRFAAVLGLMCLVTWAAARTPKGHIWGIGFALLALAYFKYTNFFLDSLGKLFGLPHTTVRLLLPLGISFYTFSAISYLADVHRGKQAPGNLLDVSLYLSFFPKLTSGPIQRWGDFSQQLNRPRKIGWSSFCPGVQIFAFGLFKKIVLADRLSVFVNQVYGTPQVFSGMTVLLAVLAYSLQIYFDFSGYSDMAIGVARMLDVNLPRNFNLPYLSHNVTEFWKRWHITLSSWLQDYLYIPLGGSRKGKPRAYLNLVLTMVIGGLWHGASWNYVIWGLLNGLALVIHKLFSSRKGEKHDHFFTGILSILATFCFVSFSWIFFRAETLSDAMTVIRLIFTAHVGVFHPYAWLTAALVIYLVAAAAAVKKSLPRKAELKKKNTSFVEGFYPLMDLGSFWGLTLFFLFCGLILCLAYTGGSPFIYGAY